VFQPGVSKSEDARRLDLGWREYRVYRSEINAQARTQSLGYGGERENRSECGLNPMQVGNGPNVSERV
jgi:hypothetical protein